MVSEDIENAEIMEYLHSHTEGAVRSTDAPQHLEVLSDGTGENMVPAVANLYNDAGVVTLYDIKTGEPSKTSANLVLAHLRKVDTDGHRMFTMTPPTAPPVRGQHRCLLHEHDPNRDMYAQWGLGTCKKANLPSEWMVEQHMAKCHKMAWATIQRYRQELERKAEQERREQHERNLVAALAGRVAAMPEPEPATRGRRAAS